MVKKSTRQSDIEKIRQEILSMNLSRLLVFSDVINRYIQLRTNRDSSWLRTNAVLFIITRGGKLTPSQLAKIMLRSRNSVTVLVEGLEKDGLVRRYHPRSNRRTVYIEVTQDGLSFIMAKLDMLTSLEDELKSFLDDDELQTLVALTRKLRLAMIEKITGLKS
jgi:DNA-binding MarR family transcriptional regulator